MKYLFIILSAIFLSQLSATAQYSKPLRAYDASKKQQIIPSIPHTTVQAAAEAEYRAAQAEEYKLYLMDQQLASMLRQEQILRDQQDFQFRIWQEAFIQRANAIRAAQARALQKK